MFLKVKTDVNEIEVVRDNQEVIDILYVQPEEQGTLILCYRDFDGEEKWETLSIEYAAMMMVMMTVWLRVRVRHDAP